MRQLGILALWGDGLPHLMKLGQKGERQMAHSRSLSDFWRQDSSDDRVRELTSVLRGSDSLIGVMGSGVRAVWSTNGKSETWWVRTKQGKPTEMRVFLDYLPLRDLTSPFPGDAVDEVIGYAAHEGGHCLWSSDGSKDEAETLLKSGKYYHRGTNIVQAVEEILRVDNILEDAFIDFHVGEQWPVLGEYIRIARQKCGSRRPIDLDTIARDPRPTYNQMCNLWIACSLYDEEVPKKLSAKVRRAMTFLMGKSISAVQTSNASLRLELAAECWDYLTTNFPKKDDPLPSKPQQAPPQQGSGAGESEGSGKGAAQGAGGEGKGKGEGDKEDEEAETETKAAGGSGDDDTDQQDIDIEGEGEEKGDTEAEAEPAEPEQEFGDFGGDAGEKQEDGEAEGGSDKGGNEQGAPGNLDEFDIRDLEEIPEELLEEILDAITHEMEDLSKSVAEVLNQPIGNVDAQTKKADYDRRAADRVREQVESEIQEMRRVFDRQAQVQSRYLGGLTVGKLDRRNLARVGTGNLRVFKRREVLETPDMAVGLLLDVSGSMSSNMKYVWATACVFAEGLIQKKGVNFLALTYTGGFSSVQTTRICDRDMRRLCIGNVEQGGGTPSGAAIASLKVLMDRMPERQKVIIHFTDGAPDSKEAVVQAVEMCRKAGYSVWAISLSRYANMLSQQYGEGNWETISEIKELPGKVGKLVRLLVAKR